MVNPKSDSPLDDALFRKLAELAPEALIAHAGGKVLWANDAAARLTAYPSAAAMIGEAVARFVAPRSQAVVRTRIETMLATGTPAPPAEETFLTLDGLEVPVEVSATPLGGGVILVSTRDLRPRQAARQAENRARAFFDATTAAMGISRVGIHVEANAAYARLFGYPSPQALVGVPILDLIDASEHPRVRDFVARRARGEAVPSSYTTKGRRRDGSLLHLDVHASSFADDEGTTTVVVMRDVTAQRQFEERLAASEQRHRELLEGVPVGVWEEDLSGVKRRLDVMMREHRDVRSWLRQHPEELALLAREVRVLSVNQTACRMLGAKDQAELVGNLHKVFIPESLPDFGALIEQLAEGRRLASTDGWNGTLSGGRLWVAVTASVVDGHDDWSRMLITTSDMTEQHRVREERAGLIEQLRHAEKLEAIGRLAGGVAHDFNNLLAAIMNSADASLADAAPGSPLRTNLDLIHEASARARDLVQQILTFGRKGQPDVAPVDLTEVVTGAMSLARTAIPSTITLDLELKPDVGTVMADRTQLNQVVLNLCTNARDAVGPHGHIRVVLERQDGRGRLSVIDDGAGMDEATRSRIFEPYMTTKQHGHGLGLAVVHGIITAAGGTIEVESSPGRGARFVVELPLVAAGKPAPSAPPPTRAGGQQQHILVVDDHPMVRSALKRLLRSLGFRTTEAEDGQAALERVRAGPDDIDLVLSDQTMPRLSGLELAKALRAERPQTPLLLCTGFSDVLDRATAVELGVKDVLNKPIDRDTLLAAIEKALA